MLRLLVFVVAAFLTVLSVTSGTRAASVTVQWYRPSAYYVFIANGSYDGAIVNETTISVERWNTTGAWWIGITCWHANRTCDMSIVNIQNLTFGAGSNASEIVVDAKNNSTLATYVMLSTDHHMNLTIGNVSNPKKVTRNGVAIPFTWNETEKAIGATIQFSEVQVGITYASTSPPSIPPISINDPLGASLTILLTVVVALALFMMVMQSIGNIGGSFFRSSHEKEVKPPRGKHEKD
jgi:hypothetical protein